MTQPKTGPLAVRFRPDLLERVEKYAADQKLTRNKAILDLIEIGLGLGVVPAPADARLTIEDVGEATAAVTGAPAEREIRERLAEKGVVRGSELPDAPVKKAVNVDALGLQLGRKEDRNPFFKGMKK